MTENTRASHRTVLGTETHLWEYGDPHGAPLILVHGFRGDHHGLEGIALELSRVHPELRIIVPDVPGFGRSPAIPDTPHTLELFGTWLREFCAEVAPEGFAVLGHSFGSLIVSHAIAHGLTPRRVILINPISAPALEGPQALLTQLALLYYRVGEALPERPARALLGHPLVVRLMSQVMAKTTDRELRAWIHQQHHAYFSVFADTASLSQAFRASVSHTVVQYAAALTQPTLLIVGDRDDITPLAAQLELRDRLPQVNLSIMPGVGHLVHYEAVSEAVADISQFLTDFSDTERTS